MILCVCTCTSVNALVHVREMKLMPTCLEWFPLEKVENGDGQGFAGGEMVPMLLFSIRLYF